MAISRIIISFLCILVFYLMGLYAKEYYDGEKDDLLFGLSVPNGLKGKEAGFLYRRVAESGNGCFTFYFKNKLVIVKSRQSNLLKNGDTVSFYGRFGEDNIFYAESCKLEKLRPLKLAVSSLGCLAAFLLYLKAFKFNFKLFIWEPRENA